MRGTMIPMVILKLNSRPSITTSSNSN